MAAKQSTKKQQQAEEFILKHRIAGAGVLLFIGALVVPWLLGAPQSAQSSDEVSVSNEVAIADNQQADIEAAIAEELAPELDTPKEVYISKITPLDGLAEAEKKTNFPNDVVVDKKPKQIDSKPEKKANKQEVVKEEKAVTKVKQSKKTPKEVATSNTKPKTQPLAKAETSIKPKPAKTSQIKVGWAVQVGVFTDKRGAQAVIDALKKHGFSPETTVVDTNKGKGTGTRVWLGPYAQRVEAAKAKTQLKNKTGEAGFIRAYP